MSRFHVELRRSARGIEVRDLGSTNGTRANGITIIRGSVAAGSRLELGGCTIEVADAPLDALALGRTIPGLIAASPVTLATLARVQRAAASTASVLFSGESGTGKERFAEALHQLGSRHDGPLVIVDCGAIPPALLASELFGHERGAFTGAHREHVGALERATGGTLLLDEIGELSAEAAQLLVGALSRRRFRRLGATEERLLDARIVAASHVDLLRRVNEGRFRADLLSRVAELKIHVPPLRERPEDVGPLIEHFLREAGHQGPIEQVIDSDRRHELERHAWPGNVRELRQVVLAALATGEPVDLLDGGGPQGPAVAERPFGDLHRPFREARDSAMGSFEQTYLSALLERAGGNVSEAARIAAIDRTHLHERLRRHGITGARRRGLDRGEGEA